MSAVTRRLTTRPLAPSYVFLTKAFPLRPIYSDEEYDGARRMLDRLAVRDEDALDEGERDYLDTLTMLVKAYDDRHFPADENRDVVGSLRFLMEQNAMSIADLGRLLGSKSVASEVLSRKRPLSRANVFKLADRFRVDPGFFLQPPIAARRAGRQLRHQVVDRIRNGGSGAAKPQPKRDIKEVWIEYKKTKTEALRNVLMENYLHLVRYNAERIHVKLPDEVELDDLMSAGIFGLMDAIAAFDLESGVKFETYCAPRIRGAILDALGSIKSVPRLVRPRVDTVRTRRKAHKNGARTAEK
jgi:antitoxin component HigA of HigAB toxin-antitoxin module